MVWTTHLVEVVKVQLIMDMVMHMIDINQVRLQHNRIDIKKEVMIMNDNMTDMPINNNKGELLPVDIMIDQLNRIKSITQSMKLVMIISITIHHHVKDKGVHLIKW